MLEGDFLGLLLGVVVQTHSVTRHTALSPAVVIRLGHHAEPMHVVHSANLDGLKVDQLVKMEPDFGASGYFQ